MSVGLGTELRFSCMLDKRSIHWAPSPGLASVCRVPALPRRWFGVDTGTSELGEGMYRSSGIVQGCYQAPNQKGGEGPALVRKIIG